MVWWRPKKKLTPEEEEPPVKQETGADNVTILGQQETTPMYGSKSVSEIMGEDVQVQWDGVNGTVTGNIHNLEEPWEDLPGSGTKTGHFFVFTVDQKYKGRPFTYKRNGQIKGYAAEAGDDEMFWVLRLDGHKDEPHQFETEGDKVIAKFDFSGVTLDE